MVILVPDKNVLRHKSFFKKMEKGKQIKQMKKL